VTSYVNVGLTNGTTYFYQVSAVTAGGEGNRSTEASAEPVTVPGPPLNVDASRRQAGGITLSWTAPPRTVGARSRRT
jgi:cellulose 1,4-beta-cellobiosidase